MSRKYKFYRKVKGMEIYAHHWKYSNALDYSGGKGLLDIDYMG